MTPHLSLAFLLSLFLGCASYTPCVQCWAIRAATAAGQLQANQKYRDYVRQVAQALLDGRTGHILGCAPDGQGCTFDIVMIVSAAGAVDRVRVFPDGPVARCMTAALRASQLIPLPAGLDPVAIHIPIDDYCKIVSDNGLPVDGGGPNKGAPGGPPGTGPS